MPTDKELAIHLAEVLARDLARVIEESHDAASREVMRQDACEAAHAALTALGATDVEFLPAGPEHSLRVNFSLAPQHWRLDLDLDVEYEDDDEDGAA